jgi:hypothetical protein
MMAYCPDHDPILAAGYLRCHTCGRAAWPADAEWLGDGTILATYPPACEHLGDAITFVVDPAALDLSPDWCNAIAATTGSLCRNRSAPGARFCHQHGRKRVRW